jgi:translation initiation factor eIF-2B subunit beta
MVVGNIVRRVLGLIREIIDQKDEADESMSEGGSSTPQEGVKRPKLLPSHMSSLSPLKHGATQPAHTTQHEDGIATPTSDASSVRRPPLLTSHTSFAPTGAPSVTSLFGLFSQNGSPSNMSTPPNFANSPTTKPVSFAEKLFRSDASTNQQENSNIKADVIEGIREILDELDVVDEQISQYALENIHADEIILTHTSSLTIQRFLLTAARKRKFTVVHVESYPNDSKSTHDVILHGAKKDVSADDADGEGEERFKPLTAAGIKVILIPDSAIFAIMSRVNKVILATHSVLANGGLVAAAGAKLIAQAAQAHQTPVVVLTGIYKLSPIYPFDVEELVEWGDAGRVAEYGEGEVVEGVDVVNPCMDYVPPELVDLYISNL